MRKAPESSRKAAVSLYVRLAVLLGKSIQSHRKLWKKNHNQIVAVNGRRRRGPQDPALPRSFCRCPGGRPGGEHERARAVLPVQGPAERARCPARPASPASSAAGGARRGHGGRSGPGGPADGEGVLLRRQRVKCDQGQRGGGRAADLEATRAGWRTVSAQFMPAEPLPRARSRAPPPG